MRYLPLLLLLASCQRWSWGGAADVLMPDSLTLGNGSGSHSGQLATHSPQWPYEGETESTYAALTWNLPSVTGAQGGLSRDAQRNIALLAEHMVTEEGLQPAAEVEEGEASEEVSVTAGPLVLNLREGVSPPPIWLPAVVALVFLLIILKMRSVNKRRNWR
jgi:hypothetical protein